MVKLTAVSLLVNEVLSSVQLVANTTR
uniref:Uncharacterized protein n=1 Tax=Anguilla anguilla TaxID=7936 RepID=A0A0E9TTL2_ANGAN